MSPPDTLEFAQRVWSALLGDLRQRGAGVRESGAFLLGTLRDGVRRVEQWVAYEDLDPNAQNYEYVRLETGAFPRLWRRCEKSGLQVLADVHTHPLGPVQSPTDRDHPMIALAGHIALIVPRFACGAVRPDDVSFNIYLGEKRWRSLFGPQAAEYIRIIE